MRLNPGKTMAELVYPRLLPASRPPISKIPTFNPDIERSSRNAMPTGENLGRACNLCMCVSTKNTVKISGEREIKIEERSVMKEGVYVVHDTREEGEGRGIGRGKPREGVESNINKRLGSEDEREEGREREAERIFLQRMKKS